MRSQEEIVTRIAEIKEGDFLGFGRDVLIGFLEYDLAQPHLKENVTEEEWDSLRYVPNTQTVEAHMLDYLDFAWMKADDHRSISAARNIDKFSEWLWLYENHELYRDFLTADYTNYGAPKLMVISKYLDYEIADYYLPDVANMAQGKPCRPDCNEGCWRSR